MYNDFSPHSKLSNLQNSNDSERKNLAKMIVENKLNIQLLSQIMDENPKVATRFMWLLSDIGEYKPMFLFSYLEFLFSIADKYQLI